MEQRERERESGYERDLILNNSGVKIPVRDIVKKFVQGQSDNVPVTGLITRTDLLIPSRAHELHAQTCMRLASVHSELCLTCV